MLHALYDASTVLSHKARGSGGFSKLNLAVQEEAIMGLTVWLGARTRSASKISSIRA